jgi:hypothetical protein
MANLRNDGARREQTDGEGTDRRLQHRQVPGNTGATVEPPSWKATEDVAWRRAAGEVDRTKGGDEAQTLLGAGSQMFSEDSSSSRRLGWSGCEKQFDMVKDDRREVRWVLGGRFNKKVR